MLGNLGAKDLGGSEFRAQHGFMGWNRVGTIETAADDCNRAVSIPVLGWPAYLVLSGIDDPGPHVDRGIFDAANFRNPAANRPCICGRGRHGKHGCSSINLDCLFSAGEPNAHRKVRTPV